MIVPMKKVFLIVQKKDVASALEKLCQLEVVHVEHQEELTGYQIAKRREEVAILKRAIAGIHNYYDKETRQEDAPDWTEVVNRNLKRFARIEHIKEDMQRREALIKQWEPWGDFNPKDIELLSNRKVSLRLCQIDIKDKADVPDGVYLKDIFTAEKKRHCIAVSEEGVELPFHRIQPPSMSVSEMKSKQEKDHIAIGDIENEIKEDARYLHFLEKSLEDRTNVLMLDEVEAGMKEDQGFVVLKGFCPMDKTKNLEDSAKNESWGIIMEDPSEEDQVPTLLRNPKWVELIKPVFSFINILPGYKELDISLVFLLFFSIFFGMLIGDAAYGAIFFLITLFAQLKLGKKISDKRPFFLMYLLSSCTIVWGMLTGTFFGQEWLPNKIQPLVPWLTDVNNIQQLCFLIAAVHLTIAHVWLAALKFPKMAFITELGWLLIVWVMYFVANLLVLDTPAPVFTKYLFIAGISMIVLTKVKSLKIRELFSKLLAAINPINILIFFLDVISVFTDVVSYIRLFAVGLATVAVADAFNTMAIGFGFSKPVSALIAAVILFAGHALNIILACMAILVHGIRLNVLEFSGHLNLEWAGINYNPFKRTENVKEGIYG